MKSDRQPPKRVTTTNALRRTLIVVGIFVAIFAVVTIGSSFYMLDYALAPNPEQQDTAKRFRLLFEQYPETKPWVDSLRHAHALLDTFVVMPHGERHHAFVIRQQPTSPSTTAIIIHGWRDQAIGMFQIARLYERMGWNVLVPDLHAHGLSEGEAIGMGWEERKDVLHWMTLFQTDTMVVHGISMGAATAMNVAGEQMPEGIECIRFVEDCGYTSVWDEFCYELNEEFGLPPFPLIYTTSLLCQLKYGWSFDEASPLRQIEQSPYPMLFIHGDNDHFVPSWMVHPLFQKKTSDKQLWITKGSQHAQSYKDYTEEYARRISAFMLQD